MPPRPPTLAAALALGALAAAAAGASPPERRVVSLNPSLTQILLAIGARDRIVGIDDRSAQQQPELSRLPRVGGLFTPSLEAVVALGPDLVALVPSAEQRDLRSRLEALGIDVLELPNITLEELLRSIEVLGARVGCAPAAAARVGEIRASFAAVRRATSGRPHPRVVFAIQREPLFVVGAGSFLDEMLRDAGAVNAAAALGGPYPRAGLEWLIAAAPELILDASDDAQDAAEYWSRWPSLPAVAKGRVVALPARELTLPGPWVDRGLWRLAEAIHGPQGLAAVPGLSGQREDGGRRASGPASPP
jgi:iron complex transport system substrate-binding protein